VTEYQFDLSGGAPPLDLANTLGGRHRVEEHLHAYDDLVAFARQGGLVSDELAERLRVEAAARPAEGEAVLDRARVLREALFRLFADGAAGGLAVLNGELAIAMAQLRVDEAMSWAWADETRLDRPLWPIVRQAAELLVS
jgi:hypothetical protein